MKYIVKKNIYRDNFKVRLTLSAEIPLNSTETDGFLNMISSCKGVEQGLKIKPSVDFQGVNIEDSEELHFQQYIIKGFNATAEEEFKSKLTALVESYIRYKEFGNYFEKKAEN